jgi:hypothetical protein
MPQFVCLFVVCFREFLSAFFFVCSFSAKHIYLIRSDDLELNLADIIRNFWRVRTQMGVYIFKHQLLNECVQT